MRGCPIREFRDGHWVMHHMMKQVPRYTPLTPSMPVWHCKACFKRVRTWGEVEAVELGEEVFDYTPYGPQRLKVKGGKGA